MAGITSWREALANPCFWTWHYALHLKQSTGDLDAFFGPAAEPCKAYARVLYGDEDLDTPLSPGEDYDYVPANVLTLAFPEEYTWALEFGGEGLAHQIYHPQVYPEGILIALQTAHALLPGLRWVELQQIVTCLQPEWPLDFAVQTLYPLLYPVVDPITVAEYDEVRRTLHVAWEALLLPEPFQLEKWLDASIRVYEQGRRLCYTAARGWHDPLEQITPTPKGLSPSGHAAEEGLWLYDPAWGGWITHGDHSPRRDGLLFAPFFDMLERQTQAQME